MTEICARLSLWNLLALKEQCLASTGLQPRVHPSATSSLNRGSFLKYLCFPCSPASCLWQMLRKCSWNKQVSDWQYTQPVVSANSPLWGVPIPKTTPLHTPCVATALSTHPFMPGHQPHHITLFSTPYSSAFPINVHSSSQLPSPSLVSQPPHSSK